MNARTNDGQLPIDVADTEEIKQAILDEPRRRIDEAPGKRATEDDRHPNASISASAHHIDEEQISKLSIEGETEEGVVADEDQDSEPSSDEDDDLKLTTRR